MKSNTNDRGTLAARCCQALIGLMCLRVAGQGQRVLPLISLFLLMFVAIDSPVVAQSWLLMNSHLRVERAAIPIYEKGGKPLAIVRADRIYGDYQRRGFFRIGVLPMLVLEGLSLELCDPTQVLAVLSRAGAHFESRSKARRAIEGRNFILSIAGQTNEVIRAQIVRLENGTDWLFQEGIVDQPGAAPISFRRATLRIAGPKAGELSCQMTNGTVRVHLLSLVPQIGLKTKKP